MAKEYNHREQTTATETKPSIYERAEEISQRPDGSKRRSRLKTTDDMRGRPRKPSLVRGLIPRDGFGRVVAEPGAGKSFLALDLMLSVARGVPTWLGREIHTHGDVVYIMTEGSFDYTDRVTAWELAHPEYPRAEHDIYVLDMEPIDLASNTSVAELLADLGEDEVSVSRNAAGEIVPVREQGLHPVLMVIDTQRGALPETDENDNPVMNSICQRLKDIASTLNCAVVLVHHTPVSANSQDRGSGAGAVRANCDFEIAINDGKVKNTKAKYGELVPVHNLTSHTVDIPGELDEGGSQVTSCWLELTATKKREKSGNHVRDAIDQAKEDTPRVLEALANDAAGRLSRSQLADALCGEHNAAAMSRVEAIARLTPSPIRNVGTDKRAVYERA